MNRSVKKQQNNSIFRRLLDRRTIVLVGSVVALVVLVVTTSLFFILRKPHGEVVLQVGDHKVNRQEYDRYVQDAKYFGIDEVRAREELIDFYQSKQVVKNFDIPINNSALRFVASRVFEDYTIASDAVHPYIKSVIYTNAVEWQVKSAQKGGYLTAIYTGYYLSRKQTGDNRADVGQYMNKLIGQLKSKSVADEDMSAIITADNRYSEVSRYAGVITYDGVWIDQAGQESVRQINVSLAEILAYLDETKEGVGRLKHSDQSKILYFANTISEIKKDDSMNIDIFNNAKQAIRWVAYDV